MSLGKRDCLFDMKIVQKIKKVIFYIRIPAIILIILYQRLFSPDHSFWSKYIYPRGFCRFTPSCSEYGKLSIKKDGLVKGSIKTMWRIWRCNPWSDGGEDYP